MQAGAPPESYSLSNQSSFCYKLMITVNPKTVVYLLKGIFNGFITELFTAAFLQNVVTEGGEQFSTRTARDTLIAEDLKGFFKCLNKEKFEDEAAILTTIRAKWNTTVSASKPCGRVYGRGNNLSHMLHTYHAVQ
jgi:hypothetical protein